MINVIITMCGEGKRFSDRGSVVPKPMIIVKQKTLFEWSILSLTNFFDNPFCFICRRSQDTAGFVREQCGRLGIRQAQVMELDYSTRGQAATALTAESMLDHREAVMIYNIDTYIEPGELRPEMVRGDGWVPAFEAPGDHWSFVSTDEGGRVTAIAEKERISALASIGLYYFRSFDLFKDAYVRYYAKAAASEEYVAPVYNILLEDQKEIYTSLLRADRVHVLGTPAEVENFSTEGAV